MRASLNLHARRESERERERRVVGKSVRQLKNLPYRGVHGIYGCTHVKGH